MQKLLLIGGGNMGGALVSGLTRSGRWKLSQITVSDVRPEALRKLRAVYKVKVSSDNRAAVRDADIVLLAVKPQQMAQVLEEVGPFIRPTQLVLSIAAGITTRWIEKFLAKGVPVVRIMPNTPALVGAGAAALACGRWAKARHEKAAKDIFSTVGTVVSVSENDLNAVTALSGSGPAYAFYLAEAMNEAGRRLGLSRRVADALVRQTLRGAGLLLAQSSEDMRTLRQRVTSPGGTTEAAFKVLEKAQVKSVFVKAIKRAQQRARELSKTS
jgi:pyrroline-5-carboxylate reductase